LKAFDIGVNSSDSEGLSNAVIEYMMAGVPAIVSDVPGNRELIEDGVEGCRFFPGDPVSLSEKLVALLRSPAVAKSMGERGREKAHKKFSSDAMIKAHMDYYERLVSEKSSK
jgi:glycosyltransferase involved in cell wall biosynthesis